MKFFLNYLHSPVICFFFIDPRLKVFGNKKVNELRAWFDNRLEEAIKAAEEEAKLPKPPSGKMNRTCFLSLSFSSHCFSLVVVFGFLHGLPMFVIVKYRAQQWTEIVVSWRRWRFRRCFRRLDGRIFRESHGLR